MTIPDYQRIMLPLLKLAGNKEEHSLSEALEYVNRLFKLTEEEKGRLLPSGTQRIMNCNVDLARTYLQKAKMIEYVRRGHFKITNRGLEILKQKPSMIYVNSLMQFTEFVEFRNVNWISEKILKENLEASVSNYKFIEKEFSTCLEYVALREEHLSVYSHRLASLIIRIGPEILRTFNIILFNKDRSSVLNYFELEPLLLQLQEKCERRRDSIADYLTVIDEVLSGGMGRIAVEVQSLDKFILPFEFERKNRNSAKNITIIPWWENGYNALRHRMTKEFREAATLENALYSLAALWLLHYQFDSPYPHSFESEIFGEVKDRDSSEVQSRLLSANS
jgi:hypothetical protein